MIVTLLSGETRVVRPGEALCGVGLVSIEITHADLKLAGGLEELLAALRHNKIERLMPAMHGRDSYLMGHENELLRPRIENPFIPPAHRNRKKR